MFYFGVVGFSEFLVKLALLVTDALWRDEPKERQSSVQIIGPSIEIKPKGLPPVNLDF